MRFFFWTAVAWLLMALGIVAVDVGYTAVTGTSASHDVTRQIDFTPSQKGLWGWMERVSLGLDKAGDQAFGRATALAEILIYGVLAPLLIAGPIGWEAWCHDWSLVSGALIGTSTGFLLVTWGLSKPGLILLYYALVNALLLCCRAIVLSTWDRWCTSFSCPRRFFSRTSLVEPGKGSWGEAAEPATCALPAAAARQLQVTVVTPSSRKKRSQ